MFTVNHMMRYVRPSLCERPAQRCPDQRCGEVVHAALTEWYLQCVRSRDAAQAKFTCIAAAQCRNSRNLSLDSVAARTIHDAIRDCRSWNRGQTYRHVRVILQARWQFGSPHHLLRL